jgi:hypothetical protein
MPQVDAGLVHAGRDGDAARLGLLLESFLI